MTTTKKTDAERAIDNVRTETEALKASGVDTRLLEITLAELRKTVSAEKMAKLREPFPASMIGKLPRVTCKTCSQSAGKVCARHELKKCRECKNYITTAHMHLDYVGHAAVTDRIQSVDPEWYWVPRAVDEHGVPLIDRNGGMWIDITILGVTRPAYGDAEGKSGGDAVKAAISDAIKNGAMRFGVGLDLWSKEDLHVGELDEPEPEPVREQPARTVAVPDERDGWTDAQWRAGLSKVADREQLDGLARACNAAGKFVGKLKADFVKKRDSMGASEETRALHLVKDELGGQEVAS